jgi:1,4-dihydroxy-6-naphthoate synthase
MRARHANLQMLRKCRQDLQDEQDFEEFLNPDNPLNPVSLHAVTTAPSVSAMSGSSARLFTLGHSPDPDDAFMFYAMAEHTIDLRGYQFEHRLEDIQTLNERALRGELDISAISIHAYAYVSDRYALLPCGASMGDGYGPMLVATDANAPTASSPNELRDWLRGRLIAVPGKMTSAYLALQLFLGEFDHVVVPFDQIFETVKTGRAATGLIIHEGQLTYAAAGFKKLLDLGEWWKEKTSLPLPLGGNVLRKGFAPEVQHDLSQIIRESIDYGLAHREAAVRHSLPYAREMDAALASKFIGMYVNDYTRDYGAGGRAAIREFLRAGSARGYVPATGALEFVA